MWRTVWIPWKLSDHSLAPSLVFGLFAKNFLQNDTPSVFLKPWKELEDSMEYGKIMKNHNQNLHCLSACPLQRDLIATKKQLLRWWPSVARSRQCAKHSSAHCDQAPVASSLCTRQWRCRWKPPAQCKANDFMSARATCRKFSEKQTEEIIREFYGLGLR